MSWIQENKFVAGLGAATAVVGGVILFFGNSQGSAYDEKLAEYEDLRSKHTKLEKAKTYPNAGNLEKRKEGIKLYEKTIDEVRAYLVGYQKGKLPSPSPEEFSDTRVKMEKELRAAFEAVETTLPETCHFGFEKYQDVRAKATATARLNFQLGAMQWLLNELAEVKPQAILNIKRAELPVEAGQAAPPTRAPRGRGGNRGGNHSKKPATDEKPYQLLPVELSFTASEASARDFLKEMVNSKEYFFSIRAIRIRNEKQTPPTIKDADFPAGGGGGNGGGILEGDDPFGGLSFPDADEEVAADAEPVAPQPKPEANGERILKQVLGDEKLHVYISFDILLIKGEAANSAAPTPSS